MSSPALPVLYHQSRRVYIGCDGRGREASAARSALTEAISTALCGREEATEAPGSTSSSIERFVP